MDKQHRRIYAAPQAGYYPALLIAGGGKPPERTI